ncbi:MAG: DUF2088 domain-containing protein [Chloroflexi bacterium]|nr:DUF2088 domain-containing protein [Chloroflexota bacterium]
MASGFPRMVRVRQRLWDRRLADIEGHVARQVRQSNLGRTLKPGASVAITAGSRGIANLDRIIWTTATTVRELGGLPFVVPAMGSHGGATAEGQLGVLASYGVTEDRMGCPIRSSMEVVPIGHTPSGMPVHLDRNAASADAIVVVNRVKKHTDFRGRTESGLMKIMAIGLGKKVQAELIHSYGSPGLKRLVPEVARVILASAPIALGLAILENGYDETADIVALEPDEIETGEARLLRLVKRHAPGIPFDELDVLVVDRIGKDISGSGLDTNVIGRMKILGVPEPDRPRIKALVALDLTPASHGNAIGLGLCDVVSRKLVDKMDPGATYTNGIISGFWERGKIPITLPSDALAIHTALSRLDPEARAAPRLVRILDTLHLAEIDASEALIPEIQARALEIVGEPAPLRFDESGTVVPMALDEGIHTEAETHPWPVRA